MRRSIVVIAGLTTISLSLFLVQAAPAKEKLNVIMNFTIEGQHAPWFVAKSNGYFDAAGLDVTIQRGYGSADTVKKVLTGVADIGFADPVPIIMAVAEGQPVKAIMGGYMQEPCALYSTREGANITSPKQMEGKTIGGPAGDICIILLAAVMERAGADFSKVTVQNMDAATRIPMLAAGRIDALGSFYEKDVLVANGLKAAGKSPVSWHYDQYINKYSAMVVTSGKMIEGKPDVLREVRSRAGSRLPGHRQESDGRRRGHNENASGVRPQLHPQLGAGTDGGYVGRHHARQGNWHARHGEDAANNRHHGQVLEAADGAKARANLHQ